MLSIKESRRLFGSYRPERKRRDVDRVGRNGEKILLPEALRIKGRTVLTQDELIAGHADELLQRARCIMHASNRLYLGNCVLGSAW